MGSGQRFESMIMWGKDYFDLACWKSDTQEALAPRAEFFITEFFEGKETP